MQNDLSKVEYRVVPVTRYMITRYHELADGPGAGSETKGQFDNPTVAFEVAYALCKAEHDRLGFPPGDERIQYPRHPSRADAAPAEDGFISIHHVVGGAQR